MNRGHDHTSTPTAICAVCERPIDTNTEAAIPTINSARGSEAAPTVTGRNVVHAACASTEQWARPRGRA
jgi:hypothetical protein